MFNTPHPITYTDHAMSGLHAKDEAALESEPKGGVTSSFDILMEELAGKIQGDQQTVRQFASLVEATVINIHQSYPDQMSESCMRQVKRTQFFHGLKMTYKETFRYLYEEREASSESILQAASTMEEALNNLMRISRDKSWGKPQTPHRRRSGVNSSSRRTNSWGWTRTGLEPQVVVHVNNHGCSYLSSNDTSSTYSFCLSPVSRLMEGWPMPRIQHVSKWHDPCMYRSKGSPHETSGPFVCVLLILFNVRYSY